MTQRLEHWNGALEHHSDNVVTEVGLEILAVGHGARLADTIRLSSATRARTSDGFEQDHVSR